MNRRNFIRQAGALTFLRAGNAPAQQRANRRPEILNPSTLERFVDSLPIPTLAKPVGHKARPDGKGGPIAHFRYSIRQFAASVHRDLKPATMWGYDGASPGPIFEARCGTPLLVEWINQLPAQHLFTIDHTLHGAEADRPETRTVVHLHGGRTPPQFDGYPELWFKPGQSATYYYPNQQNATLLFYHDHAMGITRLNTMAGLMGLYIIRDDVEDRLPLPKGRFEIPLVLYDRTFTTDGQLFYPVSGNPKSPWISDFVGNAILVNGKISPFLEVEPRRYRLRLLNGSNGGFYYLSFHKEHSSVQGETFWQIGSDQGLLHAAAELDHVFLAPGERADLIVDFSRFAGETLLLRAQAAVAMQFRVSSSAVEDKSSLPATLHPIERIPEHTAVRTRQLFLADHQDRLGMSHIMLLNGQHWSMPVTEKPLLGSTEIWELINLTDDTHPIHLHLVRFQILERRPFDLQVYQLTRKVVFTGPAVPLDQNELGWKDTVRAPPTLVTRIIVKFEGYSGRYVWHCHVLEHEDNEMMRPYDVLES